MYLKLIVDVNRLNLASEDQTRRMLIFGIAPASPHIVLQKVCSLNMTFTESFLEYELWIRYMWQSLVGFYDRPLSKSSLKHIFHRRRRCRQSLPVAAFQSPG
jgi:hypothetical protein